MRPPTLPQLTWLVLLAVTGCAGPLNEHVGLIGAELPALAERSGPGELDARPSLAAGFDRSAWPAVRVTVPLRQVAHHPPAGGFAAPARGRSPWDPAYPDASGALVDETNGCADLADGSAELIVTAVMIIVAPLEAVTVGPWAVSRSPAEPYRRLPPG